MRDEKVGHVVLSLCDALGSRPSLCDDPIFTFPMCFYQISLILVALGRFY